MTKHERVSWNTKTLQKIRTHLRARLAIMSLRSAEDKKEIEERVMVEMEIAIAEVTDRSVEDGSHLSFGSLADCLALRILSQAELQSTAQ
jgi:hypothetical protein